MEWFGIATDVLQIVVVLLLLAQLRLLWKSLGLLDERLSEQRDERGRA